MKIDALKQPAADPAWDQFLAGQPFGHYLQSGAWGQLKSEFGWQVVRILAEEDEQIVGGAQILTRRLPVWGRIGYIPKGPVVAPGRADVMSAILDRIEQVAWAQKLLVLSIQPPVDDPLYMQPLEARRFSPSSFYVVPSTTAVVDLRQSEEQILAQMKKDTRYNVRLASRMEVAVREGSEEDLPLFYEWTRAAAIAEPSYIHYSLAYYQEAWKQFAPRQMIRMFVACYQDEPLSIVIVIALGHWAVYTWGASSGQHAKKMPNYLAQWAAIQWSKEKGCHYYDLGGISPKVSAQLKQGEKLKPTDSKVAGIAHFKLGFGQMTTFPDSYDNNYGIRPRWLIRTAVRYAWKFDILRRLARGASLS